MTEGSSYIAHLGDPNRPTKIAEVYSDIYDNEWTDALDFCNTKLGKEYSEDDKLNKNIYQIATVEISTTSVLKQRSSGYLENFLFPVILAVFDKG
jgi:hypothetical protein